MEYANSQAQHPLFSREGGSPVWVPAFAGKQASFEAKDTSRNPAEVTRRL